MTTEDGDETIQVHASWVEAAENETYALAARHFPEDRHKTEKRGGSDIMYVTGETVITRLNEVFAYGWDFEIVDSGINEDADEAWCCGRLTVWRPVTDQTVAITDTTNSEGVTTRAQVTTYATHYVPVHRQQYGSQKLKRARSTGKILDIGFDLKGAATDCLKKCASLHGVALYLWNAEERAMMEFAIREMQQEQQDGDQQGQGQSQGQGRFRRFGNTSQGGGQPSGNGQPQPKRINGVEMPIGFEMPFPLVMNRQNDNECRAKDCTTVIDSEMLYRVGNEDKPGSYILNRAREEAGCVLCASHTAAWFRAKQVARQATAA